MASATAQWVERFTDTTFHFLNTLALCAGQNIQISYASTTQAEPISFSPCVRMETHRSIRAFFMRGRKNPNQSPASPTARTTPASDGVTEIGMNALNLFQ